MNTAALLMPPHYATCRVLAGVVLPETPTYAEDIAPGGPNAEAKLVNMLPYFRWRTDYPSAALDEALRQREIKRTACHETGHPFEWLLAYAIAVIKRWTYEVALEYVHRRYFEFREFTGVWEAWAINEPWKQPREGFADCFAAAVIGEWIVPLGSSQGDRFFNEGKTVSAAAAREFFAALVAEATGVTVPVVSPVDHLGAVWIPSPNYLVGGNAMTHIVDHWTVGSLQSAIRELTKSGGYSAHYVVDQNGDIYQLVREHNRAFHNSSFGWNEKAIGIEHVHYDEDWSQPGIQQAWPSVQLEASAALHRDISRRCGIPLVYPNVIGHGDTYSVFTTECPGDFPISRVKEDWLNMEITETRLREIIREEATTPLVTKFNSLGSIGLNHKLRRTARYLISALTGNATLGRDPGGVGGTDTLGYQDDNTPLA